jgi:hypothetical protein
MATNISDYLGLTVVYDSELRPTSVTYFSDATKTIILQAYSMTYDNLSNPIFLGQTLYRHQFNITKGCFEVSQAAINNLGQLQVSIDKPLTAFGELSNAELTPLGQYTFSYILNDKHWSSTLVNSGSISVLNALATVSTGITTASTATMESRKRLKYRAGQGAVIRITAAFATSVAVTTQLAGVGDAENGFFYGYNGTVFGILHRNSSSGSVVNTWTAQTSWNDDPCDGTKAMPILDQTKGNVYEVQYQFLGFGQINFNIENPDNGQFERVHHLEYTNINTIPSLSNASLPVCVHLDNAGTTTDLILTTASCGLYLEGKLLSTSPILNSFTTTSTSNTTEKMFINIRSKTTLGASVINHIETFINNINVSLSGAGTRNTVVKILLDATIPGASWSDVDANSSCLEQDTSATLTPGTGTTLYSFSVTNNDSLIINLKAFNIFFVQGETVTISAQNNLGANNCDISILVEEDW